MFIYQDFSYFLLQNKIINKEKRINITKFASFLLSLSGEEEEILASRYNVFFRSGFCAKSISSNCIGWLVVPRSF